MVLFPVAVLIVLGLGGLALDAATIFLGQRRLADTAAGLANDAVAAVDHEVFLAAPGEVLLSSERIEARREQRLGGLTTDRSLEVVHCEVAVAADPPRAVATCTAQVRPLFAPVVPGMEPVQPIEVTETAVGRTG